MTQPLPDLSKRVALVAQAMADHANEDRYVLDNGWQSTGVEPYEASADEFLDLAEVAVKALSHAETDEEEVDG